jgi:hypothetical protein
MTLFIDNEGNLRQTNMAAKPAEQWRYCSYGDSPHCRHNRLVQSQARRQGCLVSVEADESTLLCGHPAKASLLSLGGCQSILAH